MARYFSLLFVYNQFEQAASCAALLSDLKLQLADELSLPCLVQQWTTAGGQQWVNCLPQGVSLGTTPGALLQAASQLDEVARQLYLALADAGSFLAATVGWELPDLFLPGPEAGLTDLQLLAEAPWRIAGSDPLFVPFSPGYVWQPYQHLSISGW
jgi:hypothetical protein